jgi:hypothetical protein
METCLGASSVAKGTIDRTSPVWSIVFALFLALAAGTTYDSARIGLEEQRIALASELRRAKKRRDKVEIYARARAAILTSLSTELLPAWYGTIWAFHGKTDTPRKGEIACGIFVATVLEHAGFRLNRIDIGRLASEHIALSLTAERNLRRFSDKPVEEVEREIVAWGPGLYAVGLDSHAGLALVDEAGARFIHSSVYAPGNVRSEPFAGNNPLAHSRYRVFAKLLDDEMIDRWLRGRAFAAFER